MGTSTEEDAHMVILMHCHGISVTSEAAASQPVTHLHREPVMDKPEMNGSRVKCSISGQQWMVMSSTILNLS